MKMSFPYPSVASCNYKSFWICFNGIFCLELNENYLQSYEKTSKKYTAFCEIVSKFDYWYQTSLSQFIN